MKKEISNHLKARNMLYALSEHPAICSIIFNPLGQMNIDIELVCKNGYIKPLKGLLKIYYTPENYKKYKKEFDKEFKKYTEDELEKEKKLIQTDVSYKKIFGYSWKPDHIEYWGELNFEMFVGKDLKKWHDNHRWRSFSGVSASGRTFEEMIVKLGSKFFKTHGKFIEEDFYTTEEKKNHNKERPFYIKKEKRCTYYKMIPNLRYKRIEISDINRRWVKWFSDTSYGKKQWGDTLKDILSGKDII